MGLQHACLPVDWRRKALPCLSKPAAASRLNKLARKAAAAHPGPRGGGGGAGRRLRQAEGWCADAGQSRIPAGGEGMDARRGPAAGPGSCRPPFPSPGRAGAISYKYIYIIFKTPTPAAPERGSAAWDLCWEAGPFRLSGALGGGVK